MSVLVDSNVILQLGWQSKRSCFAITKVGLYLLGVGKDFEVAPEAPADVVVQPNFDIVFLSLDCDRSGEVGAHRRREKRGAAD